MLLRFFIYCFFGHFILLFKPFGESICENIHNESKFYENITILLIILFYLLIALLYLIPQIVMNLLMIIPYIIKNQFFSFIKDLTNLLYYDEII